MKVLFIDDDQIIIDAWAQILEQEEFEVSSASTGKEGIEKAKKEQPDFIIVDQIMPDMQGNDVLKTLKQTPETSKIPVAIASNYSETETMQEAIQDGAIDYILKYQIDPQDLAMKLRALIHESQSEENQTN